MRLAAPATAGFSPLSFLNSPTVPHVKTSTSPEAEIYYQDCNPSGSETVVLIHGWPLSHRMWEYQINALTEAGYRVIAYDRRGFGSSAMPWGGYDYDTMSADLHDLLEELDVRDVTLVGFSMGGGEVARYFGQFGSDRVGKAVFVSSVAPYMLKTADNPDGVPQEEFDKMMKGVKTDRPKFLAGFGKQFVNWGMIDHPISQEQLDYIGTLALKAQPYATQQCITAFGTTDFRPDMPEIDVPTMFVHGDDDQIVPLKVSAKQGHRMVPGSRLEVIEGAPHGLNYTHTEELNSLLLDFLKS